MDNIKVLTMLAAHQMRKCRSRATKVWDHLETSLKDIARCHGQRGDIAFHVVYGHIGSIKVSIPLHKNFSSYTTISINDETMHSIECIARVLRQMVLKTEV